MHVNFNWCCIALVELNDCGCRSGESSYKYRLSIKFYCHEAYLFILETDHDKNIHNVFFISHSYANSRI